MLGTRWRVFRLLGIPVSVDSSWLIVVALLTVTLAGAFPAVEGAYYPGATSRQQAWMYWLMATAAALAFFGCILLHELGHAVVARARKMSVRGITLFLFGGVAEIGDEPPSASTELLMAVAGPLVSVALAALFGALAWLGYHRGWPPQVVVVLGYLATINVMVLTFNLVPAFPLDGGRVLRAALWSSTGDLRRATRLASLVGEAFAWLLITWGLLNFFAGDWVEGMWTVLIGLFLSEAARAGYRQVLLRKALEGEPVRRFMTTAAITVPPSLDLRTLADDYVYRFHRKSFPVVSEGRLQGLIETRALAQAAREDWGRTTVGEVMRRDLEAISIPPEAEALEALGKMRQSGSSRLLVVDAGRLLGIISVKDLLGFLSSRLELGGDEGTLVTSPMDDQADGRVASGHPLAI